MGPQIILALACLGAAGFRKRGQMIMEYHCLGLRPTLVIMRRGRITEGRRAQSTTRPDARQTNPAYLSGR